tara:strand:- start:1822 stop:2706 length:885 start_codon:yes stop_codon:yes gene_type:complete
MKNIFKYILSLSLLYYVITTYGNDMQKTLAVINYHYVLLVFFISFIQYVLSAYRWMYISSKNGTEMNFLYCLKFYYISTFINNILPGGVVGDIYRAYCARESSNNLINLSKSVQGIVFERLSGQIMMFFIFLLSLTFFFLINAKYVAFLYTVLPVLSVTFIIYFVVKKMYFNEISSNEIIINFKKIFSGIIFWNHTIISFFVVLSYIVIYIISAEAIGLSIDYFTFFVFTPIVLFSMTLPVSIGGWGVREGTALLIAFLLGLSASSSISVAVMYGILNLFCSLPGLYFLLSLRR